MRPSRVHHLAVKVADLAAAEAFYGAVLGLPVLRRWPDAGGLGERSLWFDLGGDAFLAVERAAAVAPVKAEEVTGMHLLALSIPRAERAAWAARLDVAGHPVYQETDYTLYVRDPEGNRVALSHWPESR